MKLRLVVFSTFLLMSLSKFSANAQISAPKGKPQVIEFSNANAKFTVPAGKTWYIVNIFSDCATKIKTNAENPDNNDYDDVRVFIKNIDSYLFTDLSTNKLGPVVYRGPNHERIQPMPIVLAENSTIEFIITTGDWSLNGAGGLKKNDSLRAYVNYIEVDN